MMRRATWSRRRWRSASGRHEGALPWSPLSSTSEVFEKHLRLGPVLTTRWSGTQTTAPATSTPTATRAHAPVLVRVAARMELDGCTVERRDGLSGMT